MPQLPEKYHPHDIEPRWQEYWVEHKSFEVECDPSLPKYYVLEMFPYPSGRIHMGHVRNYSIGDVVARYHTMRGFNVVHPIGYDAFGMPAENAAIQNNTHPKSWTARNMAEMSTQLKRMGFSYDWRRALATCEPEYYRWEQRFLIQMFEKGLLYRKNALVNFCETCATVLANEQVIDGRCWRCDGRVLQKAREQWALKITAYAEELLAGLTALKGHWPERVLTMQREWIGKSLGAKVCFQLDGMTGAIEVFTTRPDTLFGATFMSLAPEHPLVERLIAGTGQETEVRAFCKKIAAMKREDRLTGNFDKAGVFTGRACINPATGEKIPIWLANFVLAEYGTGAVMAVPMHDQRDFEFATQYGLHKRVVIQPPDGDLNADRAQTAYEGDGRLTNSGPFDGQDNQAAKTAITEWLVQRGQGEHTVNYRLRDWGISRQRYWGTPLPFIIHADGRVAPVSPDELPVRLPEDVPFTGEGGSPLLLSKEFQTGVEEKYGKGARRETDTVDTFVESSWYFLKYCTYGAKDTPFRREDVGYWGPIDQYIGGIEHAVLHLLYARFFTKVLRDLGYVDWDEPFSNLLTQGMVIKDGAKMSKSKGNVVDPQYLIERYGADTARLFSLFAAPPERDLDWSDQGVEGAARFLARVWRLAWECDNDKLKGLAVPADFLFQHHRMVKKVTEDVGAFHFNTAIAALMEFFNYLHHAAGACGLTPEFKAAFRDMIVMLSPFVPHFAEEVGAVFGLAGKVACQGWPGFDEKHLVRSDMTIVVQVNGKLRAELSVPVAMAAAEVIIKAKAHAKIKPYLAQGPLVKEIYVPNKLVNLVVKS